MHVYTHRPEHTHIYTQIREEWHWLHPLYGVTLQTHSSIKTLVWSRSASFTSFDVLFPGTVAYLSFGDAQFIVSGWLPFMDLGIEHVIQAWSISIFHQYDTVVSDWHVGRHSDSCIWSKSWRQLIIGGLVWSWQRWLRGWRHAAPGPQDIIYVPAVSHCWTISPENSTN